MYSIEFQEAWEMYPRKIGKALAFKKYNQALKRGSHAEIIRGIIEFAEYTKINRTEQKYIPHFSTWINNDRWNDDLSTERSNQRRQSDTGLSMVAALEVISQNSTDASMERSWNINGDEDVFYLPTTR